MKFVNKNYYEILDIDPKATEEDVKRAYRMVRSTWNPDSIAIYSLYTPEESEAIGHKIEEAFQILSNTERRASYDRYLKHVDRVPATLPGAESFWDLVHDFDLERPSEEQELLEDVTDLLSDPGLEPEELEAEVVLEATGGDARAIERAIADERHAFEHGDAIPDREGGHERAGRTPALATAGAPSRLGSGSARVTGSGSTGRPAPREPKPLVPAAPAAPPVKGAPVWTAPTDPAPGTGREGREGREARDSREGREVRDIRSSGSQPTLAEAREARGTSSSNPASSREGRSIANPPQVFKHGVSAPRTVPGSAAPEAPPRARNAGSSTGNEPPKPAAGAGGWSRNFATQMKPTRALPERPISAQMLADAESDHGLGGTFLRMVREYKGISLADIAERTKIQTTYLRYVEEESYEHLPPAVYIEGFVTQVARLLKLDIKRVVAGYMARYHAAQQQGLPEPTEPDEL